MKSSFLLPSCLLHSLWSAELLIQTPPTTGFVLGRSLQHHGSAIGASRRDVILETAAAVGFGVFVPMLSAVAEVDDDGVIPPPAVKKPFAPLENLLPAARVKWTIDRAIQIASRLDTADQASIKGDPLIEELQGLLLMPRNYTDNLPPIPDRPAKEYLETYERNRQQLNLLEQPGALLVQAGEISAWKRLKRQERRKEEQDEIRAALNIYTTSLNYRSDAYMLNVSPSERSQMVRQDRLPDIKQVIQSDMGLRYLYRNDLLTAMQEVRAELDYQMSQDGESFEVGDLSQLLKRAQSACNQWFSFIDEADVKEAIIVVEKEEKTRPWSTSA